MTTREIAEKFPGLRGTEATDAMAKAVGSMNFFRTGRRTTPFGGRLRLYRNRNPKRKH
ncbi:hypothetical protein ABZW44_44570 [Streptomyces mirabilis]|uniref:hypothetical protein n=1 Tax=Streptomyces mirabilis TaxID=68239 RepID=UPI0033A6909D